MFGYVLPCRHRMTDDEFSAYRSYYCGLCKQLGKSYGQLSRFLLNYDLVLPAILTDGLSGEKGEIKNEACLANPFQKRQTLHATNGLSLAADALVILSYQKLCDNLQDEKLPKKLLYLFAKPYMKHIYKKAQKKQPGLSKLTAEQMQLQASVEQNGSTSIDEACNATAKMCEEIFAACAPAQANILSRLGLFTGQIIYLLDAAEDYESDLKNGGYNVFCKRGLTKTQAADAAKKRCNMAAGEIALCYNLLNFKQHKALCDNIFFIGLPASINRSGEKRTTEQRHALHEEKE